MGDKYLLKGVSLTGLKNWLNENKKKQTGLKFTIGDVQQYAIKFKRLPKYLGGNKIEINPKDDLRPRTYNLLK